MPRATAQTSPRVSRVAASMVCSQVRDTILPRLSASLDRLAAQLTTSLNQTHSTGYGSGRHDRDRLLCGAAGHRAGFGGEYRRWDTAEVSASSTHPSSHSTITASSLPGVVRRRPLTLSMPRPVPPWPLVRTIPLARRSTSPGWRSRSLIMARHRSLVIRFLLQHDTRCCEEHCHCIPRC